MGPGFLNLKLMCSCLARAVMKHLEFSHGEYLFLEDLKEQKTLEEYKETDEEFKFSYHFKKDLKLNGKKDEEENDDSLKNFVELENKLKMGAPSRRLHSDEDDIEEELERDEDDLNDFLD
mmetsp:Transcript_36783/g.27220  ORF Transcript_36783/g.27220 Transcript_36783/m.27220 type:complete len:120 (+) Transcript_36783:464-823(+)|eukprot:CAMPEP_0202967080 /NCGR_PEP_ID=MMETSP1396-20130829/11821_1 /ASSEMBLY_ACC=CAM_ASM_000872 /TAXON_ID= /ORGANISM="Pseudokeronopsis sp., Strain Brazil" /LENGTH=119 /DNA_ID=CAMNT_0049691743 /DNA_START=463 /DNA_END=822 /DNA_ORIENTATION=+